MESSSSGSFLWTDASSSSSDSSINNMPEKAMSADHIEEFDTNEEHTSKSPDSLSENLNNKLHKSTKKKKGLDILNSPNHFQSDEKHIKLEPESDLEVKRKKARKKDGIDNNDELHNSNLDDEMYLYKKVKEEQASISSEVAKAKKKKKHKKTISEELNHEDWSGVDKNMEGMNSYLDIKVKEEQISLMPTKEVSSKKKKKNKSLNINNDKSHAESIEENSNDMESYLNLRVKEEQASHIKLDQPKSKKKKKRRSSVSDIESINESKSVHLDNTVVDNEISGCAELSNVEYSIIDEKFSAEETVVQNPKKKKKKKDIINYSAICDTKQGYSDDDTSLQPDFSCNNIVSSTIINTSIDSRNKISNNEANNIPEDSVLQHENKLQKIKISDRIRFEDDENSSQEIITSKISSKIQNFLRMNTNVQVSPQVQGCTITDDDEIWLLRCPLEVDPAKLKNMKLLLEGKCKIKINGQTFDGVPNQDQNRITLLTNHNGCVSVSNFPVKGSVIYRKRIPKPNVPQNVNIINNQTNFIPLPETKCRHPLFGNKYKKAMKIPTEVAERLEAAKSRQIDDSCENSVKKKKKKKNKSMDIKVEEKLSSEPEPLSKKRKRKLSQDNDIPHKKRKQIKHDPDSAEVWESEKAIEENLFNF